MSKLLLAVMLFVWLEVFVSVFSTFAFFVSLVLISELADNYLQPLP